MSCTRSSLLAAAALLVPTMSLQVQAVTYDPGENDTASYDTNGGNLELYALGSPSNSATQSGVITGSGSVTKRGNSTLRLTAANTFTGGTTVSEGRLSLERANNDGVGTIRNNVLVSNSLILQATAENALGYNVGQKVNRIELLPGARFIHAGTGQQGWGVSYVLRGDAYISSNNAHVDSAGNSAGAPSYFTFGGPAGANSTITAEYGTVSQVARIYGRVDLRGDNGNNVVEFRSNSGATLAVNAVITGTSGIVKTGQGRMELNSINTYAGTTTLNEGVIAINARGEGGIGGIRSNLVINNGTVTLAVDNALGYTDGSKVNAITMNGGFLYAKASWDQGWGIAYQINGGEMISNEGVANAVTASKFAFGAYTTVNVGENRSGKITGRVDLRNDLNPDTDITVGTGGNLQVDAAVTGPGGIKKLGPGKLTLTAANTFTGTLNVSAGSVEANASSLPANVVNNGSVVLTGEGNCASTISGSGTLKKINAGTMVLSGTKTHTGGTILGGGSLSISNNALLGAASAPLTFSGGTLTTATDLTIPRAIAAESLVLLRPTAGTLTLSGVISGTGGLEKSGEGGVVLTSNNTYSGMTTVQEGRLILAGGSGDTGAIRGALTVNPGATAEVSSSAAFGKTIGERVTGVTLAGSTLTSSGTASIRAGIPFTVNGDGMTSLISGQLDLLPGASFDVTGTSILNVTADVVSTSGGPGFRKKGTGKMILAGQNSYAGTTSVDRGTLQVNKPTGTRYEVVRETSSGVTAVLEFATDSVVSRPDGAAQSMFLHNFGFINFRGTSSAGAASYEAGQNAGITFYNSASAGSGTYLIGNGSNVGFAESSNGGSAVITLQPGGKFDYVPGNSDASGARVVTQPGSWVTAYASSGTFGIGSLSGSARVRLDGSTLSWGALGLDDVFSGAVEGAGGLVKTGGGTLTISGTSTHSGGTRISSGKLVANNTTGSALGSGAVSVAGGAALGGSGFIGGSTTLEGNARLAPGNSAGTLSFTNGLTLEGGSVLDLELGTVSDAIRVSGGTLSGPSSGKVTVNLSAAGGFKAGTYTLIDASGAGWSNLTAESFVLGTTIAGYNYSFVISGSLVQLSVVSTDPYEVWSSVIVNPAERDREDDPDGDGLSNLQEFLFGGSPLLADGALSRSELTPEGLLILWLQRSEGATYQLQESVDFSNPWPASELPVTDGDQSGLAPGYTRKQALAPLAGERRFFRIQGEED